MKLRLAAALPGLALTLATVRWWMQGSGNVWTDGSRSAYVPDPDVGWRFVEEGPPWLGLDVLGFLAGLTVFVFVAAVVLERRGATGKAVRTALWTIPGLSLAVPLWAFAGGFLPEGAKETLDESAVEAPDEGFRAHLDGLPRGTYRVVPGHEHNAIIASVSAAGEAFDTRFTLDLEGEWAGDPSDLSKPATGEVRAAAAGVDTGVELRSKHAKEYLHAETFPTISVSFGQIDGTDRSEDGTVSFGASGTLRFIGDELPIAFTGTLRALDDAARQRLGVSAEAAFLLDAGFTITISETKLRENAGDFTDDTVPIRVNLILAHGA